MPRNPFGWDLPPGVTESMLPGNTGYDDAFDEAVDRMDRDCYDYVVSTARSIADNIEDETGHEIDMNDLINAFVDSMRRFGTKDSEGRHK